MEQCMSCQYYDRKHAKSASGEVQAWGQCRRGAPMLSPVNAKSYMIEGVWPTVRDDDWCGEWKVLARRVDSRVAEARNAPVLGPKPIGSPAVRAVPPVAGTPGFASAASASTYVTPAVMGRSASD